MMAEENGRLVTSASFMVPDDVEVEVPGGVYPSGRGVLAFGDDLSRVAFHATAVGARRIAEGATAWADELEAAEAERSAGDDEGTTW